MKHMLIALLVFICGTVQAQEQLLTLQTRPSVTLRMLLLEPAGKPVASLILFTGGDGVLKLGDDGQPHAGAGNFLVRTRQLWVEQGFQVAVVDAPSDHPDGISRGDFRSSAEHAQDMAVVIDALHQRADVPVWLVGTSRGTTSAAAVAIRLPEQVGGVVLTSTINHERGNVAAMNLAQLTLPVLVVQHLHDQCKETLFRNVQAVMDGLHAARARELILVDGGKDTGDPCQPWAAHGYNGIEAEVVEKVARWIRQH
ncbi:alpha/beta hydrolase [Aquitalea denitrificans]|uniref:alpha/beta hydrolase n=1 Tax=Aquitalea denitrificans TaxID=519081 RepID=UPI00135895E8|nr:alpha/beta hydrolase [Aquitalea denitrificans]